MKLRYYETWSLQECFSGIYMGNPGIYCTFNPVFQVFSKAVTPLWIHYYIYTMNDNGKTKAGLLLFIIFSINDLSGILWDLKLAGVFQWNVNGKSRIKRLNYYIVHISDNNYFFSCSYFSLNGCGIDRIGSPFAFFK